MLAPPLSPIKSQVLATIPPDTTKTIASDSIKEVVAEPAETGSALAVAQTQQKYLSQQQPSIRPSNSTRIAAVSRSLNSPSVGNELHALASAARGRTTSVLSNLAVRTRNSASSLRSLGYNLQAKPSFSDRSDKLESPQTSPGVPSSVSSVSQDESPTKSQKGLTAATANLDRPSIDTRTLSERPSVDVRRVQRTSSGTVPPQQSQQSSAATLAQAAQNKMHQTSSRLLRMTDEERPYTRDFKDLFSTLMVSLPLTAHRIRFTKIDHTFTSEEAINNLGSLKFSQSNRMPDPKDPSRIVTTTTTTTFSMAKEMARSVCQRFMDARFVESADGKNGGIFPLKGALWQMTPKGMHILQRFCQRNGINSRHIIDVLESPRNQMQLVILERDPTTDKVSHDRATVEVIFRRFVGQEGPNLKNSTTTSDSDSVNEYYNGMVGVKMARERKIVDRIVPNTFTGKAAIDWLMDCCTTVDRRETYEIAEYFVQHGLMYAALEDKVYTRQNLAASRFQPTKEAIYGVTEKGEHVAGWTKGSPSPTREEKAPTTNGKTNGTRHEVPRSGPRDSNNNRLQVIVNDAALRLLFREYLRDTHCEENLSFYIEVREFTKQYDLSEKARAFTRLDAIRENLAAAYGLYNAFLAPGSPCELNIDHNLRNSLAGRMTRAVGDDESMLKSLQDVVSLFKEAQNSVFKLMSSDSVPKFLKEPKYARLLGEHNFDPTTAAAGIAPNGSTTLPERTLSRTTREVTR